jgi:hypothetical protein
MGRVGFEVTAPSFVPNRTAIRLLLPFPSRVSALGYSAPTIGHTASSFSVQLPSKCNVCDWRSTSIMRSMWVRTSRLGHHGLLSCNSAAAGTTGDLSSRSHSKEIRSAISKICYESENEIATRTEKSAEEQKRERASRWCGHNEQIF